MAKDPGNRLNRAQSIAIAAAPKRFRQAIGGDDSADFFRFRLGQRSSASFSLNQLRANADLALLNGQGRVITQSRRAGNRSEQISASLDAGTYFLWVMPRSDRDSTRYQLRYSAIAVTPTLPPLPAAPVPAPPPPAPPPPALAPSNTTPAVVTAGITIPKGTTAFLGNSSLRATDAEQPTAQLVYTLNALPQSGTLLFGGTAIAPGAKFTQADIDAGRLSYANLGGTRQLNAIGTNGSNPVISDSNIAWQATGGSDGGSDFEIFFLDSSGTRPLTQNTVSDFNQQISGSNIVWQAGGGDTSDIFLSSGGAEPVRLTTDAIKGTNPQISGSNVVWYARGGNDRGQDYEIFYWNGTRINQLTTNDTDDVNPVISGSNIAWQATGGRDNGVDSEIFFFDGTATRQLITNDTDDLLPQISGSNIVWQGVSSDGNSEIFFSNGGATPLRVTTNTTNNVNPQISGSNIVWQGVSSDGSSDSEIFFSNGGAPPTPLTTNTTEDNNAQISGSNIIWQSSGSSGTNSQIFFSNLGGTPLQLTTNNVNNFSARISGANVVWSAGDRPNLQVLLANAARQDSFGFTVTDGVGGSTAGTFNFMIG